MPSISKPTLKSYGDSFSKYSYGNIVDQTLTRGDIKTDQLLKSNLTDEVEFTLFEKEVRDFTLANLGAPTIRVELTDFQIKTAIDRSVSKLNYHAPLWTKQFAVFSTEPNVNLYELPSWMIDNITYVGYKKNLMNSNYPPESFQSDMFMNFFRDNFAFGDFSIGEFYLLQSWLEIFKRVIGADGSWDIINGQYLQLYPPPTYVEEVIIEYRALDSNTIHPAYRSWAQRYALAIAKGILGRVRSKYKTMPSPGGGAILDGEALLLESKEEVKELEIELVDEIEENPLPEWG